MRIRTLIGIVAVLAVLVGLGVYFVLRNPQVALPVAKSRACTVQADGEVSLDDTQMANAATIAAVAIRRGLPERAVVVALATALQESKLENLAGGDRDSIGLFQQRPSQGWGRPEQIRDPRYAAGRFYDGLMKVRGWQRLRVTEAAQAVQRSAFPEAYEKWADESTVLTTALLGQATGAVACTFRDDPPVRGQVAAAQLSEQLRLDWGDIRALEPSAPGVALPVVDSRVGWQYAHWLVAHAAGRGVLRVRFDNLQWTATGGRWERVTSEGGSAAERVIAEVYTDKK